MGYTNGLKLVGKVWHFRFVHGGKLHRGSTEIEDYNDAMKWLSRYKGQIALRLVGGGDPPTLGGLLKEWKEVAQATNAKEQIDSMVAAITKHFHSMLDVRIDRLDTIEVKKALVKYLKTKGTGPGRKKHTKGGARALLLRLNTLMNFAIKCKHIDKLPYDVPVETPQKKPRTIVRAGRMQDFLVAMEECTHSEHIKLAISVQAGLGLRESEALGLDWSLIDWETNSFIAGRFEDEEDEFITKGKEAERLPLPDWLRERLHRHWLTSGKPIEGLVLPGPEPDSPHPSGYTSKAVARIGMKIGLPGLTPHSLRSGFITSLIHDAGVPLPQVMKLARHKQITTTMKYDQGAESLSSAMERLQSAQGFGSSKQGGVCPNQKSNFRFKLANRFISTIKREKSLPS